MFVSLSHANPAAPARRGFYAALQPFGLPLGNLLVRQPLISVANIWERTRRSWCFTKRCFLPPSVCLLTNTPAPHTATPEQSLRCSGVGDCEFSG